MNEDSDRFCNQILHLLRGRNQSVPQILRSLSTPPHSQQSVVMINNGLGDNQGVCRVGQEAVDHTLQSCQLRGELCCSFGVAIEPFLNEFELFAEVVGGSAEGR